MAQSLDTLTLVDPSANISAEVGWPITLSCSKTFSGGGPISQHSIVWEYDDSGAGTNWQTIPATSASPAGGLATDETNPITGLTGTGNETINIVCQTADTYDIRVRGDPNNGTNYTVSSSSYQVTVGASTASLVFKADFTSPSSDVALTSYTPETPNTNSFQHRGISAGYLQVRASTDRLEIDTASGLGADVWQDSSSPPVIPAQGRIRLVMYKVQDEATPMFAWRCDPPTGTSTGTAAFAIYGTYGNQMTYWQFSDLENASDTGSPPAADSWSDGMLYVQIDLGASSQQVRGWSDTWLGSNLVIDSGTWSYGTGPTSGSVGFTPYNQSDGLSNISYVEFDNLDTGGDQTGSMSAGGSLGATFAGAAAAVAAITAGTDAGDADAGLAGAIGDITNGATGDEVIDALATAAAALTAGLQAGETWAAQAAALADISEGASLAETQAALAATVAAMTAGANAGVTMAGATGGPGQQTGSITAGATASAAFQVIAAAAGDLIAAAQAGDTHDGTAAALGALLAGAQTTDQQTAVVGALADLAAAGQATVNVAAVAAALGTISAGATAGATFQGLTAGQNVGTITAGSQAAATFAGAVAALADVTGASTYDAAMAGAAAVIGTISAGAQAGAVFNYLSGNAGNWSAAAQAGDVFDVAAQGAGAIVEGLDAGIVAVAATSAVATMTAGVYAGASFAYLGEIGFVIGTLTLVSAVAASITVEPAADGIIVQNE